MNERYGYDPYGQQPRIVGYDEYGRPVHEPVPPQGDQGYETYDPFAAQPGPQQPGTDAYGSGGYGYDPYGAYGGGAGQQPGQDAAQHAYPHDYPYGPYGQQQETYPQQDRREQQSGQQEWIPQQAQPRPPGQYDGHEAGTGQEPDQQSGVLPGQRHGQDADPGSGQDAEYRTEQFSFIEEPTDDSEDVIDWLKFTESRTERREEAKRRGRHRVTALVVVLVLLVVGGVGWLWYDGKLPGLDGGGAGGSTSAAGQQRDVIVVHLRSTDDGASSTALLVDNAEAGRGTTVLLPNSLAVTTEDGGTTTLAKSVEDEGASPTREGLDQLLGAQIKGTWRLDTPYLETLVEMVGGITVDTDTAVPGAKKGEKPQVERGRAEDLDGRDAVAYATYRAHGETQAEQLARFGAVMKQTLRKLSSDPDGATKTVESLGQVSDPSLSEAQLGASLSKLAEQAKGGSYGTKVLPVLPDGTLSRTTSEGLVKNVLGGTVRNSDPGEVLRVKVSDASGGRGSADAASVALVNSGYTVVDGATGGASRARSQVTYTEAAQRTKAAEVATTLGLQDSAVHRSKGASNTEVSVVLGRDYKG